MTEHQDEMTLGEDILKGGRQIARYLLGDETREDEIYRLDRLGKLPTFKIGKRLFARRSTLRAWIERQENKPADAA